MPQVVEGVYRLGSRYINWYVIEQGGKLTVIDAGLPGHWEQLPQLLGSIGKAVSDVEAVVLTHYHPDHLGVAARVRRESGARVLVHPTEIQAVSKGGKPPPPLGIAANLWRPFLIRYFASVIRDGGLRIPGVADASALDDGEVLDVPGSPKVIHVAGHTPGSCALFIEDKKLLFSGDALVMFEALTGNAGPRVFARPFTADEEQAMSSLDRLEETGADVVLPGHGEPWKNGVGEAVRLARQRGPA